MRVTNFTRYEGLSAVCVFLRQTCIKFGCNYRFCRFRSPYGLRCMFAVGSNPIERMDVRLLCFRFLWPYIMNIGWRERNQLDATNLMFIIKLLSQHVSGIIMPIIMRTVPCTTAYGVLHWLCWLWFCGAGSCERYCSTWSNSTFHTVHTDYDPAPLFDQVEQYLSHSAHRLRPSSTEPQPAQPVQNTICGSTRSCSPDDGHNDARNMLR